jgi:hypothetical protein
MSAPITLNFLLKKSYPQIKKQGVNIGDSLGYNLSVKHAELSTVKYPRKIEDLGPCVGFALYTPQKKLGAHSAPEIDTDLDFVTKCLTKKIHETRKASNCKDEEMSAVIYGGIAYDSKNSLSNASCELVDSIERACQLEGIEPTIITGQFSDGLSTRLNSYLGNKQITIWSRLLDKIKLTHKATQEEVQKALEELFEYVKIGQNTKLKIIEDLPYKTEHLLK